MHPNAPEKTTPFNVVTELQLLPLHEIQQIAKDASLPFAIAIVNVSGDLNVGMLIRTAAVFGASQVYIFGRRKYDRRSTVGAHHYVPIESYPNVPDDKSPFNWSNMIQLIYVNGWTPVVIEQGGAPLSDFQELTTPPPCLIFGPEDTGVPASVCETEKCYTIPQLGVLRSLNVAVAAGIAMHHVAGLAQR